MIDINNLTYNYPDSTRGLRGISLRIGKGESVALLGPNGAGKTTLIHHLNGILPEKYQENILISKIIISKKNIASIRRLVGILFQNSDNQLFMPSVREDISFAPRNFCMENAEEVITDAIRATNTFHLLERHPQHLSLGEKKLVALAGILAQKPEVLILDEPAAGLDPHQKSHIIKLLKNLTVTKIIATHEIHIARHLCTRAIILYDGKLVEDGPVSILEDKELLRKYGLLEEF